MRTILNKKYLLLFTTALFVFTANAQLKINDMKWKSYFMLQQHQPKNLNNQNQLFKLKINPYWEDVNAPHAINNSFVPQVKVPTINAVWAKMSFDTSLYFANRFLRTADGGRTWLYDTVDAPPNYALGTISAIDANTCYASMYNGFTGLDPRIYKTIDGGNTWKQIGTKQVFKDAAYGDFVYFFDAKNGLAVGDGTGKDSSYIQIYITDNAGKTWQRVPDKNIPPIKAHAAESFVLNAYTTYKNRIWVRGDDLQGHNYIWRSDDLGHHWQLFPFPSDKLYISCAFADYMNGITVGVAFDGTPSYELVTHDGGETWTDLTPKGPVMGAGITVIPYTHTYVSALPYNVSPVYGSSYSNDNGKTWTLIDSGAGAEHADIAFLNPFVGWTGRTESSDTNGGMYKWKYHFSLDNNLIAANANDDATAASKNNTTTLSVYPNPVSGSTLISFNLSHTQKTSLAVYDMNGRLIKALINTQLQQGNHQITWNTKDEKQNAVSAGMYIVKLQAGNDYQNKKISVVR